MLTKHLKKKNAPVPVRKKIAENQVKNSDGGFVFALSPMKQLERFLILGTEGGTYYCSEKKLTRDNATVVETCLKQDPDATISLIEQISHSGRALKNDPAILALAIAAADDRPEVRRKAFGVLSRVCRTSTHLFHFCDFYTTLLGSNTQFRKALGRWYNSKDGNELATQFVKYRQRDGWTHRDVLRLAHPLPSSPLHQELFRFAVKGDVPSVLPKVLEGYLKVNEEGVDIPKLVSEFGLPWEAVPTGALKDPKVWEAFLPTMGATAMVRNLGKMSSIKMLERGSDAAKLIKQRLTDGEYLKKNRVHPMQLLVALRIYQQGHGDKGKLSWAPVPSIIEALEEAFYLSFNHQTPLGGRTLIALDVSGSMTWGAGMPAGMTPREVAAALAMIFLRVEDPDGVYVRGFSNRFIDLGFSRRDRLNDVVRKTESLPFTSTDCSLPAKWAEETKTRLDRIIVVTDNETNSGSHPFKALQSYRKSTSPNCRQVVCGVTATKFTIADPSDPLSLDVVGFDAALPQVITEFCKD